MSARVLIADDHPLTREGLGLAARSAGPGLVIDYAGSVAEAEALASRHKGYRLAILDLVLPDAHGFAGFLRVQHALGRIPIVLISALYSPELVETARALGAAGYLSKTQPLDALVPELRAALGGATLFSSLPAAAPSVERARAGLARLSGAQLRTLLATADGRSNKQIAGELGVTEATVKAHLSASFRKLGVRNRAQAMLLLPPVVGPANELHDVRTG